MKTSPGQIPPTGIEWLETRIAPAAAILDLSTLDGTNGFALNGAAAGDMLGASARGIGDINGDTHPDLVVGAPLADDVGTRDAGRIAVLFGSTSGFPAKLSFDQIDGTNGFVITGEEIGDTAGYSVGAGDVNGDGLEDLIIGAPYGTGILSGIVYIVYGRETFPQTLALSPVAPGVTRIFGESQNDAAGFSVSSAGDFNNDGKDDILIGAPNALGPNQIPGAGAAYLVYGATALSNTIDLSGLTPSTGFKIPGVAQADFLGSSVNSAGDFNSDGFDDIVIGALGADSSSGINSGSAFVIFGTSTIGGPVLLSALNGSNGFRIDGEAADDHAGTSLTAGDLNTDDIPDLVVSAPGADPNGPDSGAVYVVYGREGIFSPVLNLSSATNQTGFKIQGEAAGDAAGVSLVADGDFNGDGLGDLVIGAPGLGKVPGAAYILFGTLSGFANVVNLAGVDGTTGLKLIGVTTDDATGSAVAAADLNADGFDDVIIGAKGADPAGTESGTAYVVYGFDTRVTVDGDGQSATFTEADGDVVTVSLSRGGLTSKDVILAADGSIQVLDLTDLASPLALGSKIKPLNINISVKTPDGGSGDGFTKVGFLNADGVALGKLKLAGDLGRLVAGAAGTSTAAKSVKILGNLGTLTGAPGLSKVIGGLGKLSIKGNLQKDSIDVDGNIKSLTIGGDFIGDPTLTPTILAEIAVNGFGNEAENLIPPGAGVLRAASIGKLKIAGGMKGGGIATTKDLGVVSINGDLYRGNIFGGDGIKKVKIVGKVTSDSSSSPATITARNKLGSMVVNGDVENACILVGYNDNEDPVNPDATVGKILVKGDWIASSLAVGIDDSTNDGFGRNDVVIAGDTTSAVSKIASVVIKGTASGSSAFGDHFGITAQQIGKVSIDGALVALTDSIDDILIDTNNNDFRVVELG